MKLQSVEIGDGELILRNAFIHVVRGPRGIEEQAELCAIFNAAAKTVRAQVLTFA